MDNKEMEMKKLDTEELDPVAGGSVLDDCYPDVKRRDVDYKSLTCPHCGGKYGACKLEYANTNEEMQGWEYYTVTCKNCGHQFSYGYMAPDVGVIGKDGMQRGAAEQGLAKMD